MSGPETEYEIHLVEGVADVPAKVTTERLDFYDTGVWTAREEDGTREFFPYERIEFIRERPAVTESAGEGAATDDAEASAEQDGDRGPDPDVR